MQTIYTKNGTVITEDQFFSETHLNIEYKDIYSDVIIRVFDDDGFISSIYRSFTHKSLNQ